MAVQFFPRHPFYTFREEKSKTVKQVDQSSFSMNLMLILSLVFSSFLFGSSG